MVTGSDFRLTDDGIQPDSPFNLPDWVMALNEGERSGRRLGQHAEIFR
jgi:F-box and WD-40 domain protein 1/11